MKTNRKNSFIPGACILSFVVLLLTAGNSSAQSSVSNAPQPSYTYPTPYALPVQVPTAPLTHREKRLQARMMRQQSRLLLQEGRTTRQQARQLSGRQRRRMMREGRLTIRQGHLERKQARLLRRESHQG